MYQQPVYQQPAYGIPVSQMSPEKFEEYEDALSVRRNIVVMADEAHRGQYGLTEKIKFIKNESGEDIAKTS